MQIVKLGGSLLDFDGLPVAWPRWRRQQGPEPHVVIAGGGRLADCIRDASERFPLSEETAHWLCIRLLSVTCRLVAELLGDLPVVDRLHVLRGSDVDCLFDVGPFLRDEEQKPLVDRLPHTWDVTSDSIAAQVAEVTGAGLTLLKSRLPGDGVATTHQAAVAEYVDRYFPVASSDLPSVRCVDLRDGGFPERSLATGMPA